MAHPTTGKLKHLTKYPADPAKGIWDTGNIAEHPRQGSHHPKADSGGASESPPCPDGPPSLGNPTHPGRYCLLLLSSTSRAQAPPTKARTFCSRRSGRSCTRKTGLCWTCCKVHDPASVRPSAGVFHAFASRQGRSGRSSRDFARAHCYDGTRGGDSAGSNDA